jgi:hypothetical protein
MDAWEAFAVYLTIGAMCVLAYTMRVLLVVRKPIGLRTYLWRATKVFFLWPVSFFLGA